MNRKLILGIGVIVVVFVLFFAFAGNESQGDVVSESEENQASTRAVKEFDVVARNWEFVPGTIEVNQGDRIVLNVESVDGDHGIMISEFGVNEHLSPGEETMIEFVADKKGTFTFFCNVYCGAGHSNMRGELIVR